MVINDKPTLVGGLEHEFYFHHQVGMMIQSDELTFSRWVETTKPGTQQVEK